MRVRLWKHLFSNGVAYLALFIALSGTAYAASTVGSAQIIDGSVKGADIKDRSVTGLDIARRAIGAQHLRPGTLARGRSGASGPAGAVGTTGTSGAVGPRGPSFGDARQVGNVENISCTAPTVVGTLALTVATPSRVWTHGQGTINQGGAPVTEGALWLRLKDAAGTVVASTVPAWDADDGATEDAVWAPSPGGLLLVGGGFISNPAPVFVAAAGAYTLELVAFAQGGTCTVAFPDFGWNQGGALGYVLLGTG